MGDYTVSVITDEQAIQHTVEKLSRDLKKAAANLKPAEVRFLVDRYYQTQENRIRSDAQVRSLGEGETGEVIQWFARQDRFLEGQVKAALNDYASRHPVGQWAMSIMGIGPVISAGLLAHIDIKPWRCMVKDVAEPCNRAKPHSNGMCGYHTIHYAGHIWRFAGLDSTVVWEKGEKRPWNATLKVLCWKLGESFVKVSGKDSDYYGHVYLARKKVEQERNSRGDFKDQAAVLAPKFGKDTEARKWYDKGMLPPGHIHARAKRYAVKLFLSHFHHVLYETTYGKAPPMPYIIEHGGEMDYLGPPNWPMKE